MLSMPAYADAGIVNCTQQEQLRAEDASTTAHDWDALHLAYQQFENCDDGGTAEGFSDTVMKLLADKWETAPRMFELTSHDSGFKRFVLNHINATGNLDVIKRLQENAQSHCIAHRRDMCKLIVSRAKLAVRDMD